MTEPIEGTYTEVDPVEPGHEIVASGPVKLAVTPQVQASELVERLDMIREAQDKAMVADVDYGVIPGTNKPTLLKPGAEKLSVLFQLDVQLVNEKTWGPDDHLTVVSHATVYYAPNGARLGYGEGVCSTRERKYAYRKSERVCPECGKPAVIKGNKQYGGGWLCWKKKDGCGTKWPDGDQAIEGQTVGDVDNPDLPDLWNTAVKMAEKRARVDAVLAVTGASALFTQDVEDQAEPAADETGGASGGVPPDEVQRMEQARQRARERDNPAHGYTPPQAPADPRDERISEETARELETAVRLRTMDLSQVVGMLAHVSGFRPGWGDTANPEVKRSAVAAAIRELTAGQCAAAYDKLADLKPKEQEE